jgi:hypothetical protein
MNDSMSAIARDFDARLGAVGGCPDSAGRPPLGLPGRTEQHPKWLISLRGEITQLSHQKNFDW